MYEELVKSLRVCGDALEKAAFAEYETCLYKQAADVIEELSKPRWISVDERLPEKNGYYLTYVESALFPNSYYINMIKFIDGDFIEDHCVIHRVTHWMPLPEPPKEET